MLQCVAVRCSVLQCVAVCCSVLQCVAVCRSVLQCVAVCCGVLQSHLGSNHELMLRAVGCVAECVAACCSVLQRVAVCGHTWAATTNACFVLSFQVAPACACMRDRGLGRGCEGLFRGDKSFFPLDMHVCM